MVNKRGFIKTLEAIIAIILIILFLSIFIKREGVITKDDEKSTVANSLVNEIQSNDLLRNCVLNQDYKCIGSYLNKSIKNRYYYNFSICTLPNNCALSNLPKTDVYAKSFVITSNLTKINPSIIRIYLWNRV